MKLRTALGVAAVDLYHQSWRLVLLNVMLGAAVLLVGLASIASPLALALVVLIGPAAVTVMHCAVTLAQTEDLRLADAITGLRRHWRRGLVLGLLVAAVVMLGAFAVPFYASAGRWGWPLAALSLYVVLVFFVVQLALWPLAVFDAARPLRELAREAGLSVLRRPLGFVGLGLALLVVNAAGLAAAILPFLSLTIAYSFLVSAHYALPKNPAREV
jgi:hypothetical protein